MKLEEEIKQKAFPNEYIKANVNLFFTQAWMQLKILQELKPYNISLQQFNILRILRGSIPNPASISELTERMLDKSSNASRLVDKLLGKGYVDKSTCEKDNRRMEVFITEKGLTVLAETSEKVEGLIQTVFNSITEEEASQLNYLLDKIRA